MFTRLSLKYQIAVIIIVLVTLVLALALERTLSAFTTSTRAQIERTEHTTLVLLQDTGHQALLTEEYEHARKVFTQALQDPYVHRILLADVTNRIVFSTTPEDEGSPLPALTETAKRFWRTADFTNNSGKLGLLAIEFSTAPLLASQRTARNLGVGIAAMGILLIAVVALGMGVFLTQRLGKLTHAAQRLAVGEDHVEVGLHGQDELAQVGHAFDTMAQNIEANRKQLEDAHAFLQSTLDTLSAHIAILDESGTILAVNDVWRRFAKANACFGSSYGTGTNYLTVCDMAAGECAEEAPHIAQGIREVISGQCEHFALEYPCHSPEEQSWFMATATCFESPDGIRVVVAHENITDRKQAEEALRQSEAQIRAVLDTAVDSIISITEQGHILSFNPAAERLFGYRAEEVQGQNIAMLMPSPYREAHDGYLAQYRHTGEKKIIGIGREVVGQRKDNTTFPMELAVGEARVGDQRFFTGIVRDITARKQAENALRESEEKFRGLVEGSIQAVLIQRDGKPVFANQALADLHGYAAPEVILQLDSYLTLIAPHEHRRQRWNARERGETASRYHQVQAVRRDGTLFWAEYSATDVHWEGAPASMIMILDITERKQAEEVLQRSHDELEQRVKERTVALEAANEEVRRFAYIVSHDLRAPLINLKGFAGELRDLCGLLNTTLPQLLPHLGEPQRTEVTRAITQDGPEALGFIETSVTRMDGLIRAVLDLSRAGQHELQIEPVDTEALAQHIVQTLTHQLTQHDARITTGPLPTVNADYTAMEQILGNLLGNAIKYLEPNRPGEITVWAECQAETTTFHVCDNGRGIAEDDVPRVFELFRRAGRQDTPGEGMGLAYVQTLIRRHGGEITCQSTLGVGTTFSFTIANYLIPGDTDAAA